MKIIRLMLFVLIPLLFFYGCDLYEDLFDPTDVHNPSITEENLLDNSRGGAEPLLVGLRYSLSDAVGQTTVFTDVTSDNYDNTFTFLSNIIDVPRDITPTDNDLDDERNIYFELQTLHAKSLFGINVVLPNDADATSEQWAEVYFHKGMALLMLSENFAAFPIEENGPAVRGEDAIDVAISDLKTSIQYDPGYDNSVRCRIALARAYRLNGDAVNAALESNNALALSTDYVMLTPYDATNLRNYFYTFAVDRTSDDMQPLPRLDFLDPKYTSREAGIPILKSEEAYLILAEVSLFNSNLSDAKNQMINAIELATNRGSELFNDASDPRTNRPNSDTMLVKADATSDAIAGLIVERGTSTLISAYPISYTSLTTAYINSLTTSEELYRALYLLRQEIFFGEGRRMSDLGIRLPVMNRQIDANPNINPGDYGTYVVVPDYIPQGDVLDAFTIDGNIVTIAYDMNKLIAQNISVVSPFK
ncbi:MAG: hypothetical protein JXA68_01495 [Ignavibacteriales bacterium]|nr:hypothetical protein [Ignavibacteriales bacterium]